MAASRPGGETERAPAPPRPWAELLAYAALFFLAGRFSYWAPNRPGGLAIVWLPTGVQIAALLVRPRAWRAIALLSLAIAIGNSLLAGRTEGMAIQFALENCAVALASAALVRRATGGAPRLDAVRPATAVVAIPAAVAAGAGALVRLLLQSVGGVGLDPGYWVFWLGTAAGVLLVVPAFLAWRAPAGPREPGGPGAVEGVGLVAAHAAALAVIAGWRPDAGLLALLPAILWAALRFGPRGATASGAVAVAGSLVHVAVAHRGDTGPLEAQLSLAVLLATGLVVAAAFAERRAAAAELRDGRDLLQAFFDHSPSGMFIKDDRHRAVALSRFFESMFGERVEGMLGRTIAEQLPGDIGEKLLAMEREVISSGRPRREALGYGNLTFLDVIFPIPRAGRPPFVGGFVTDLTDRVRAEQAVADERERLAVTLRSIGDGVIATDTEGRIVLLNQVAETLTGWSQAAAAGQPLSEVFRLLERPGGAPIPDPLEHVRGRPASALPERATLWARDGRELRVSDSAAPILDREGRAIGHVLVFRDVTESERRDEALARAQRIESLAVLAGGIAHDFNNLLTGIQANVSFARTEGEAAARDEALADVEAATTRATALTRQLLTFSKGGAPVKRIVDLAAVIRESATFSVHGSRAICQFDLAPDLWPAEVDPGQIGQVIQNLVLNAVEAMPDGGRIRLEAVNVRTPGGGGAAAGCSVRIRVTDEGTGIPAELAPRVFDPFFTTKRQGTGLGLAVCQSIVSRHGGLIDFRALPGQGTTFELLLPAVPGARPRPDAAGGGRRSHAGRVLVMDDEELLRRAAARIFSSLGCEVTTAADGREAVELFRAARAAGAPFDGVILDLTVPGGMGGVETLARLREIDPGVKAIVSSGYSNDPIMADRRGHGFAAVLVKPYGTAEAERALAAVLPARSAAPRT